MRNPLGRMKTAGRAAVVACVAAGGLLAGGLLAGGASAATVPGSFKAMSLAWVTQERGWVLGTAPCGAHTCTEVIATSNGGTTWTQEGTIPAPLSGGNSTTGVSEIRFATPTTGWAFGPDLYRTADGGRTWTREAIPGKGSKQLVTLATAGTAAYAVTSLCGFETGQCTTGTQTVWRTGTLAKESWVKTPLTLAAGDSVGLSAFGSTVYATAVTNTANLLYASTNGGATFASRPVPCSASQDLFLSQAVATSATRVDLLCDGDPGFSQAVKTVYRSVNTGKTDTSAGTMGPLGIQAQLAASPSGNLAVASSSDGSFIYINDSGGTAWSMPVGIGDGGFGWNDITYVTDSEAWVVYWPANEVGSVGKVLVTHDGGRHWNIAGL
jgi:hypothetical protein